MSDIAQGAHAKLILNPGDVMRISTAGVATVAAAYGAPAGTTTITANTQDFGPYQAPAKLIVTAGTGSAGYRLLGAVDFPSAALSTLDVAKTQSLAAGVLAPYLGQIATRCNVPNTFSTGNKWLMALTSHFFRDGGNALRIVLPGFKADSAVSPIVETGTGGSIAYAVGYQAPDGSITQMTFGGSPVGFAPDGGMLTSDLVSVPAFSDGDQGLFRIWAYGATGGTVCTTVGSLANSTVLPDQLALSATALADQSMGGTIVGTASPDYYFTPCAILGYTTKRSFGIVGDSRGMGAFEVNDRSKDLGEIARGIGSRRAYINLSISSDRLQWWLASNANRLILLGYTSDAILPIGVNDLNNGRTSTQVLADMATARGLIKAAKPAQRIYQATISPVSTSTDNWATTANQTTAAWNANRVAVNTAIRGGALANLYGSIEIADQVESYRDSGLWAVNGQPNYFSKDGLHSAPQGYQLTKKSGVVRDALGI